MVRVLSWLRGDRPWFARAWEDWCILCYYLGCVLVGAIAVGADDIYQHSGYGDVWSIAIAIVGTVGVGAWLDRATRGEAVIVVVIAALTLAHGLMILAVGGPASLQTGCRLLIAPLMMVPFSVHRARKCVDPLKVVRAIETRADES